MPSLFPPIDRTTTASSPETRSAPRTGAPAGPGTAFDAVLSDQQGKSAATTASAEGKAAPDNSATPADASATAKMDKSEKPKQQTGTTAQKAGFAKEDPGPADAVSADRTLAASDVVSATEAATNEGTSGAAPDSPAEAADKPDTSQKSEPPTDALAAVALAAQAQSTSSSSVTPVKATDEKKPGRSPQEKLAGVKALSASETNATEDPQGSADETPDASVPEAQPGPVLENNSNASTDAATKVTPRKAKAGGIPPRQQAAKSDEPDQASATAGVKIRATKAGSPSTLAEDASTAGVSSDITQSISNLEPKAATTDDGDTQVASAAATDGAAAATHASSTTFARTLESKTPPDTGSATSEARFADANHASIVNSVHADLLPNGGTMKLHLDPPELGALHVTVAVRDGVVSANFQASNDQAARLLSHSLGDLKAMLETQGVSVEKLHVSQAPRSESARNANSDSQPQSRGDGRSQHDDAGDSESGRRDQHRQEMLRKMWARLTGKPPLDMVA